MQSHVVAATCLLAALITNVPTQDDTRLRRDTAIAEIAQVGEVRFVNVDDQPIDVAEVKFEGNRVTDGHLAQLKTIRNVYSLLLIKPEPTADGVVHLKELPVLTRLVLVDAEIGDGGLEHVGKPTQLRNLHLLGCSTNITDAALEHLKGCTNLMVLDLASREVTDAGLKHLKEIKSLTRLNLYGTKVSDAGVPSDGQVIKVTVKYVDWDKDEKDLLLVRGK